MNPISRRAHEEQQVKEFDEAFAAHVLTVDKADRWEAQRVRDRCLVEDDRVEAVALYNGLYVGGDVDTCVFQHLVTRPPIRRLGWIAEKDYGSAAQKAAIGMGEEAVIDYEPAVALYDVNALIAEEEQEAPRDRDRELLRHLHEARMMVEVERADPREVHHFLRETTDLERDVVRTLGLVYSVRFLKAWCAARKIWALIPQKE